MDHPEESDDRIEGIVPLRESALNVLSEAIRKHDFVAVSPTKKECPELTPVTLVALAAERVLGEPAIALCGVRLGYNGYNDVSWHKQQGERAVKRP